MSRQDSSAENVMAPIMLEEEKIDLSDQRWDDGVVLILFWVLAFVVFLQFFTRYVLNDSIAWTEEIARFLLIGVTFIGAGVYPGCHLGQRLMPPPGDFQRIGYFAHRGTLARGLDSQRQQVALTGLRSLG